MRLFCIAIIVHCFCLTPLYAQSGTWRYKWQKNQVLTYKVKHITSVSETLKGTKENTKAKLDLVKQWKVLSVDGQGTATVELRIVSMRNEQFRPNGDTILFDSNNLAKSTPELKKVLTKFIGQPLAVLRIDATGKVIEAKKGSLSRYQNEPPFLVTLPGDGSEKSWQRRYTIVMSPLQGTGEKYDIVQSFNVKSANSQYVALGVTTTIANLPKNKLDQIPLFQKQPVGTIIFDTRNGRLHSAIYNITRELENHQGKGSRYRFESSYKEELVKNGM